MIYDEFFEKVKEFEGFRSKAYKCPSGLLTIGYGHTFGVVPKMCISISSAELLLHADIEIVELQLQTIHPNIKYLSNLYFALTDFIFNVGFTKYKNSTLKKIVDSIKDYTCLTENDISALTVQFLLWTKSNGKTLRGLENRRMFEISLLHEK